jgi:glucose-1-phosphate thymidylyltransferase
MREPDGGSQLTEAQRLAASAGHKGLMPVGGAAPRPFLDFLLSSLADAGCDEVCLVVAPDHDAIRRHYESARPARVRLAYAIQERPLGTANALLAAEGFAGDAPFLALNSDNLYPVDVLRALVDRQGPGLPAFESAALVTDSGFSADRVAGFAVLQVDSRGRLQTIVEKPGLARVVAGGPRALVSMNVWRFDARIFEACRDVPISTRGEYELPEAVALALARGMEFEVVLARGAVLDLSRRSDVVDVGRRLAAVEAHP